MKLHRATRISYSWPSTPTKNDFLDKKYGTLSMNLNGNWTNRFSVTSAPNTQNITIIANLAYQF